MFVDIGAASGARLPEEGVSRPVLQGTAAPRGSPLTWTRPERAAAVSAPAGGSGRRGRGARAPHGPRPWTAPSWRVTGRPSRGVLSADWLPRRKCRARGAPGAARAPSFPFPTPVGPGSLHPNRARARARPRGHGSASPPPLRGLNPSAALSGARAGAADAPELSSAMRERPGPPRGPSRCLPLRLGLPGQRHRAGPPVCPPVCPPVFPSFSSLPRAAEAVAALSLEALPM